MKRVLLTAEWMPRVDEALRRRFQVTRVPSGDAPFATRLATAMSNVDILCPTPSDPISAELIRQFPDSLRLIAVHGAGTDAVAVTEALQRGICVSNTPAAVTEDTADLTFGLILAACRGFSHSERHLRAGAWKGITITGLLGRRVNGSILGIIGMGAIGKAVARRAAAFNMTIVYADPVRAPQIEAETGATHCHDIDEVLRQADIVTLHCVLNASTHHLIDRARLALMKTGAVLINAARGPLVEESALVEALNSGAIGAAGLDVYEHEPRLTDGLLQSANTVLLPHLGTATMEAREAMGFRVLDNIEHFLETGRPLDEVRQ